MNIKNLKPSKNSKFLQGYFRPTHPEKYQGDPTQIIFRSSWENRFASWCDLHPFIIKWSSEPINIPYLHPIDKDKNGINKVKNYFVDFYIVVKKDGQPEEGWLIEIKPNSQTKPPNTKLKDGPQTLKKMQSYNWQLKTFLVNKAKFHAAVKFASDRGCKFAICDENFLF